MALNFVAESVRLALRREIRSWETDFEKQRGRKPGSRDISKANMGSKYLKLQELSDLRKGVQNKKSSKAAITPKSSKETPKLLKLSSTKRRQRLSMGRYTPTSANQLSLLPSSLSSPIASEKSPPTTPMANSNGLTVPKLQKTQSSPVIRYDPLTAPMVAVGSAVKKIEFSRGFTRGVKRKASNLFCEMNSVKFQKILKIKRAQEAVILRGKDESKTQSSSLSLNSLPSSPAAHFLPPLPPSSFPSSSIEIRTPKGRSLSSSSEENFILLGKSSNDSSPLKEKPPVLTPPKLSSLSLITTSKQVPKRPTRSCRSSTRSRRTDTAEDVNSDLDVCPETESESESERERQDSDGDYTMMMMEKEEEKEKVQKEKKQMKQKEKQEEQKEKQNVQKEKQKVQKEKQKVQKEKQKVQKVKQKKKGKATKKQKQKKKEKTTKRPIKSRKKAPSSSSSSSQTRKADSSITKQSTATTTTRATTSKPNRQRSTRSRQLPARRLRSSVVVGSDVDSDGEVDVDVDVDVDSDLDFCPETDLDDDESDDFFSEEEEEEDSDQTVPAKRTRKRNTKSSTQRPKVVTKQKRSRKKRKSPSSSLPGDPQSSSNAPPLSSTDPSPAAASSASFSSSSRKKPKIRKVVSTNFHRQIMKKMPYRRKRKAGIQQAGRGRAYYHSKKGRGGKRFVNWEWKRMKMQERKERVNQGLYCDLLNEKELQKAIETSSDGEESVESRSQQSSTQQSSKSKSTSTISNPKIDQLKPKPQSLLEFDVETADVDKILVEHFGHEEFRSGQKTAIETVLSNKSCLLVLPTGHGKSLCYQLPALILPGLTLVITPLISLMHDQLEHLPECLPGAVWNSSQSQSHVLGIIRKLRNREIKVLYISPERLFTPGFQRIIKSLPSPGVSFACIDEAHCVSAWSHNFRPSYLKLDKVLRDQFGLNSVLALTATATQQTQDSICRSLNITSENVVRLDARRKNLSLSVSRDTVTRLDALISLLQSDRFKNLDSLIIYVMLRRDAENVAAALRGAQMDAAAYHAGKGARERREIQDNFMIGKTRIVVATIAFGMGLDKTDVRGVIHYDPPKSFEHYVQEIGRAGRDGLPAECHVFFGEERITKLKSLIFSDGVDRHQVEYVLERVFGVEGEMTEEGSYLALPMISIAEDLDVQKEVVETLLSQIDNIIVEGHNLIEIIPSIHNKVKIGFLSDPKRLASIVPIVDWILKNGSERNGIYRTEIIKIATNLEIDISEVQRILALLQANHEATVDWDSYSYVIHIISQPEDFTELVDSVFDKLRAHEQNQLLKLNTISQAFRLVALDKHRHYNTERDSREHSLYDIVETYFLCKNDKELLESIEQKLPEDERLVNMCPVGIKHIEDEIRCSIKILVGQHENTVGYNARVIARILHSISSKQFPYREWKNSPLWGKHITYPFDKLLELTIQFLESWRGVKQTTKKKRRKKKKGNSSEG